MVKKFKTVVIGGTFDHLHKGHKAFIEFSLSLSDKVIIGLTSDEYVGKVSSIKYQVSSIESYEERKVNIEKFLSEEKSIDRISIIQIEDIYGPTISEKYNFDALIVVEKTLKGAGLINIKRKELGFSPLEIIIAPSIKGEDGITISSSRIRNGETDDSGKLFINPKWLQNTLHLPDSLREELKKPFGELIKNDNFGITTKPLITVGDVTTQKFNKLSIGQKISIIDFNVAREKEFENILELGFSGTEKEVEIRNEAGQISPELFNAIISAFLKEEKVIIKILGEDDLAVLPVVLAAPLESTVFYGQPGSGLVKIEISEKLKQRAYMLLTEFVQSSL